MYDVALGMYDFQLVLMVAEKSQKVSSNTHVKRAEYVATAMLFNRQNRLTFVYTQFTF